MIDPDVEELLSAFDPPDPHRTGQRQVLAATRRSRQDDPDPYEMDPLMSVPYTVAPTFTKASIVS